MCIKEWKSIQIFFFIIFIFQLFFSGVYAPASLLIERRICKKKHEQQHFLKLPCENYAGDFVRKNNGNAYANRPKPKPELELEPLQLEHEQVMYRIKMMLLHSTFCTVQSYNGCVSTSILTGHNFCLSKSKTIMPT